MDSREREGGREERLESRGSRRWDSSSEPPNQNLDDRSNRRSPKVSLKHRSTEASRRAVERCISSSSISSSISSSRRRRRRGTKKFKFSPTCLDSPLHHSSPSPYQDCWPLLSLLFIGINFFSYPGSHFPDRQGSQKLLIFRLSILEGARRFTLVLRGHIHSIVDALQSLPSELLHHFPFSRSTSPCSVAIPLRLSNHSFPCLPISLQPQDTQKSRPTASQTGPNHRDRHHYSQCRHTCPRPSVPHAYNAHSA